MNLSIVTLQQRVEAVFIIPGQRVVKTSSEASRRCNRQRVETWQAEPAHTEHVLKLRRALTLALSRAGSPEQCPAQRRDGVRLTCAAAGTRSTPRPTTAARSRRPSPSKKAVSSPLKEESEPSGRSHPPASVHIELRVKCKLGTVGTVVARASARWLRLILGHAQASDVSSENG